MKHSYIIPQGYYCTHTARIYNFFYLFIQLARDYSLKWLELESVCIQLVAVCIFCRRFLCLWCHRLAWRPIYTDRSCSINIAYLFAIAIAVSDNMFNVIKIGPLFAHIFFRFHYIEEKTDLICSGLLKKFLVLSWIKW